jgi:hypothetical protein
MLHEKIITIEQFNVKLELAMNEWQDIYSIYEEEASYWVLFWPIFTLIVLLLVYMGMVYFDILLIDLL